MASSSPFFQTFFLSFYNYSSIINSIYLCIDMKSDPIDSCFILELIRLEGDKTFLASIRHQVDCNKIKDLKEKHGTCYSVNRSSNDVMMGKRHIGDTRRPKNSDCLAPLFILMHSTSRASQRFASRKRRCGEDVG